MRITSTMLYAECVACEATYLAKGLLRECPKCGGEVRTVMLA